MPKKSIGQIEQIPMDCWQAANLMHGLRPGDAHYNDSALATSAANEMRASGWKFQEYNEWGEEVHVPPGWTEEPPKYP